MCVSDILSRYACNLFVWYVVVFFYINLYCLTNFIVYFYHFPSLALLHYLTNLMKSHDRCRLWHFHKLYNAVLRQKSMCLCSVCQDWKEKTLPMCSWTPHQSLNDHVNFDFIQKKPQKDSLVSTSFTGHFEIQ